MSARRYLIGSMVCASILAPVLIGTSCPSTSSAGVYNLITGTNNLAVVPACNPGYVCVQFTNSTTVPVNVALYRHNGFDSNNKCSNISTFACCTNPNSQVACPCPCQGADVGECELSRDNLFTGCSIDPPTANLDTINGAQSASLPVAQSLEKRIRCGDVKTLGAAVSMATENPVTAAADQNGPVYRDEPGGVRCGGTVQFLIIDLNQTTAGSGGNALVTLSIRANFSQ